MLPSSHPRQLTSASERVPASSLTCSPLIRYMHHGIPSFAYAMRLGCLAGWTTTRGLPCCRTSPHPLRRRQTCPSAAHAFQLTGHSNWCRFLPPVLESNMPLHLDTFSPHSLSTWTPQNPRNFLVVDADGDILQVSCSSLQQRPA